MQNGNEWLIYKFNIAKPYFEKIITNGSSQNFPKYILI